MLVVRLEVISIFDSKNVAVARKTKKSLSIGSFDSMRM